MAADARRPGLSGDPTGFLTEIRLQRELRDEAYEAAEHPKAAWLESGELGRHARGAQDGLEALVMGALSAPDPPADEEIAEAAGFSAEDVLELKVRIGLAEGAPPADAPPPRRRWFRR